MCFGDKVYMYIIISGTTKIFKEIAVLLCENAKKFLSSLAPLARIFIDFLNVSVLSVYFHL